MTMAVESQITASVSKTAASCEQNTTIFHRDGRSKAFRLVDVSFCKPNSDRQVKLITGDDSEPANQAGRCLDTEGVVDHWNAEYDVWRQQLKVVIEGSPQKTLAKNMVSEGESGFWCPELQQNVNTCTSSRFDDKGDSAIPPTDCFARNDSPEGSNSEGESGFWCPELHQNVNACILRRLRDRGDLGIPRIKHFAGNDNPEDSNSSNHPQAKPRE